MSNNIITKEQIKVQHNIFTNTNSILVASLLCVNSLSMIVATNGIVAIGTFLCFIFLLLLNIKSIISNRYFPSFFISLVTIISFLFNIIVFEEPIITEYFLGFLCFGLPMLFLPIENVSYRNVIRYVMYFGAIFIPFYILTVSRLNMLDVTHYNSEREGLNTMTISYRVLPFVGASFIMFMENSGIKAKLMPLLVGIPYCIILFIVGSRGALISMFALFLFYYINGNGDSMRGRKRKILAGIIIMTLFLFFDAIIDWLYVICQQNDINILAINRLQNKLSGGEDLDSGRAPLIKASITQIINSPFWGNGIASSSNYKSYPHNVLVQIFEEGGLIVFIPFLLLFCKGIITMLTEKLRSDFFLILIFVFGSGLVQLMFSANYWTSQFFWAFVFLVIYKKNLFKHNSSVRYNFR